MKHSILILSIMTALSSSAQTVKATTIKKFFNQETSVSINIASDATIVWALLTNAADYTRWNSTITSLEGSIELGETIRLKSYLDEKRVFKIKIKEMVPEKSMRWGDGQGNRLFEITPNDTGVTFHMREKIGGIMYPMYKGFLPPFEESFERFAMDLKREAELISRK